MKVLSLFSGGGLGDYGLTLAGMEIVGQVEIDDYCQKLLEIRWPQTLKHRDIETFLLPEASHVRTFLSLIPTEKVLQVQDLDCGENICASFAFCDPNTSSLKTYQGSLFGGLETFSATLPVAGTMRNGKLYRQPALELTTYENESGFWPTPRASQDYKPIRKYCPQELSGGHGEALCAYVGERWPHLIGKYMNPSLMEVLMGLPTGWTDARLAGTVNSFLQSNGSEKES